MYIGQEKTCPVHITSNHKFHLKNDEIIFSFCDGFCEVFFYVYESQFYVFYVFFHKAYL